MITGAIFDVDGVLLDSMPMWDHAGELYLQSVGVKAEPDLKAVMFSMTMEKAAEYLKIHYHLPYSKDEIINGINHTIENYYFYKAVLKSGVTELLNSMKQRGISMTVATATDRYLIEAAFKRTGIYDFFDKIFTCSEIGAGKVKPDIYIAAQNVMQTERDTTWVFEDALHGAVTAHNAGFKVVGVYDESSSQKQDDLIRISDVYLKNYNNISRFYETIEI